MLLQHDGTWQPYTARTSAEKIKNLHLECLLHPVYSSDLTPSDYHMFGSIKETFECNKFSADKGGKERVRTYLSTQSVEFFEIQSLVRHWCICIECNGGYNEKLSDAFFL